MTLPSGTEGTNIAGGDGALVEFTVRDLAQAVQKQMAIHGKDAKSILEYSLIKPITPLNLSESDIIKSQKSPISSVNVDKTSTH